MLVDDANCERCKRRLWGIAVWVFHDGGPLCERCLPDELYDEVLQMYDSLELPLCDGLCGRYVLDVRDRGQTRVVCSASCRRRAVNDHRRMERRAKRSVLPPIRCVECGVDLYVTRSDMRYCSGGCRVRAHRRRQRLSA
jgi:hypothetical protein